MSAPFVLNNVATADSYESSAAVVRGGPEFVRFSLQVYGAAVGYELQNLDGSWQPETFLGPVVGVVNRVARGIRFRSWVPGSPAQVTVDCLTVEEVVGGGDSLSPPNVDVNSAGQIAPNLSVPTGTILPYGGALAPASFVLGDGSHYDGTDPTYLPLWQIFGNTYGGASQADFAVPDLRGRVPVGHGLHADVSALGANEGVAAANRRPKHRTSKNDPGHSHSLTTAGAGTTLNAGNPIDHSQLPNTSVSTDSATTGITVGTGVATDALDAPAYIVINYIIKL